ncbi:MAG: hypothetical protein M3220_08065 [Chloroflexota bacterium]|nr:hypothetical protein [Chloroflexota bacterium]
MAAPIRESTHPHVRRHWIVATRLGWIALAALVLALFWQNAPFVVHNTYHGWQELQARPAIVSLVSFRSFVLYLVVLRYIAASIFILTALLLFWRRSSDWIAIFVSTVLLIMSFMMAHDNVETWHYPPLVVRLVPAVTLFLPPLFFYTMLLLFYLFPDGRFNPPWTRWVVGISIVLPVLLYVTGVISQIKHSVISRWEWQIVVSAAFLLLAVGLFGQIYRYRKVSTPIQRQQTRLVVFSLTLPVLYLCFALLMEYFSTESPALWALVDLHLSLLVQTSIPLAIAISIFRYRLYDIDILINKTLVYGTLTSILALIYFSTVVLMQSLFRILTEQSSDAAVVLSTLTIAALFNPLRQHIQEFIDLRFYRRKYDAQKTLAAFATTVRNEVELDKLTGELLTVIEETMQPSHVSLWLRSEVPFQSTDTQVAEQS